MESHEKQMGAEIKAAALVLFVITAVVIVRFTPVKEFLTAERLGNFLENAGFLAPLAFIIVYAAGVCLFVPGTLLTALGAAIFESRGNLKVRSGRALAKCGSLSEREVLERRAFSFQRAARNSEQRIVNSERDRIPQFLNSLNPTIVYHRVIWPFKTATRSGNQKWQPETAIETATRSGKKQQKKI